MGIMDVLKSDSITNPFKAIDKIKNIFGGSPEKGAEKSGNSIFDFLKANPETKEKAESIKETAEKERAGLFGEVASSLYRRWFPNLAKFTDLAKAGAHLTGIKERGPEAVPWQHEFETITAFSLLVPDSMLKPLVDPLAKSELFQKVVEYWPTSIPESMKAELAKPDYDPDVFFDIIRVMNQDIAAGKTTVEQVLALIPGGALMGGGMMDRLKSILGK